MPKVNIFEPEGTPLRYAEASRKESSSSRWRESDLNGRWAEVLEVILSKVGYPVVRVRLGWQGWDVLRTSLVFPSQGLW